jgi:hypothetical protein
MQWVTKSVSKGIIRLLNIFFLNCLGRHVDYCIFAFASDILLKKWIMLLHFLLIITLRIAKEVVWAATWVMSYCAEGKRETTLSPNNMTINSVHFTRGNCMFPSVSRCGYYQNYLHQRI